MPLSALKLVQHLALYAAVLALVLLDRTASAAKIISDVAALWRFAARGRCCWYPAVRASLRPTMRMSMKSEQPSCRRPGYFVVFVDYVSRRMQNNCAHISLAEVSADIIEAATWVRDQSSIDAGRISVIGWSYGGGGVLAAMKAMPGAPPIAKAVMYYPVAVAQDRGPLMLRG